MSLPWCCWPPDVGNATVDGFGLRAVALVNTANPPATQARIFGIDTVLSIGLGHVRLALTRPIALENFDGQATIQNDKAGYTAQLVWLDSTTVDVLTFDNAPDPVDSDVMVEISFAPTRAASVLQNPAQVLGANLALWIQADLGIAAAVDDPVATWLNQNAANGNALQGTNPAAPILRANQFGHRPGVSFESVDAGMIWTPTTPYAIGNRPYLWTRAKLNQLVHTPGTFQPLSTVGDDPTFVNSLSFSGFATGAFDPNAYWDWLTVTPAIVETFQQLVELDLNAHTFQTATQQAGALVVDGTVFNAPSAIAALTVPCNKEFINNNTPGGAPPGTAVGYWNIGVLVRSYTQPTAPQIAAVKAWCDAYR